MNICTDCKYFDILTYPTIDRDSAIPFCYKSNCTLDWVKFCKIDGREINHDTDLDTEKKSDV